MPKEILRQVNWNGGELDPRAQARRDTKAYFQSAALIENLVTTPQGPLVRRPGLTFVDRVRRQLEPVALTADMIGAPNGGTPAHALPGGDALATTTAMEAGDYVIATVDFGADVTVSLVDLIDVAAQDGGSAPTAPPPQYPYDPPPYPTWNPGPGWKPYGTWQTP